MKLLHSKLIKHENKNRENFNDFEILSLNGRYWQSKSHLQYLTALTYNLID